MPKPHELVRNFENLGGFDPDPSGLEPQTYHQCNPVNEPNAGVNVSELHLNQTPGGVGGDGDGAGCTQAPGPLPPADEPWTAFRIVYDNRVGADDYVRLELNQIGEARVTMRHLDSHLEFQTTDETLAALAYLIGRGLPNVTHGMG